MFKFWYEKFLMRFSFAFAFLAFLGVFVYAYFTEITIKLPGDTAPFTETLNDEQTETIVPDQRSLPLEKPHRGNKELQNWLSMAVSESLSLNRSELTERIEKNRPYFDRAGFRQYLDYLKSSGIIKSIRDNNYQMNVYVEQQPLLQNSVPIDGVYRWLYQMPVTLSFIRASQNGTALSAQNMTNRKITLNVQIRRVKLADDPNAVQIESWSVSPRRD